MATRQKSRIGGKKFTFDDLELILLSLPTVIWYILFSYLPLIGVLLSFKKYRLIPGSGFFGSLFGANWAGFENFKFLFMRDDTWAILGKTIGYNLIFIVLNIVVPVALAIIVNNLFLKNLGKVCQTMMFMPYFMSWVVGSYFILAFLSSTNGLVTKWMESAGMPAYNFYGEEANSFWPFLLVFLNLWKSTGYNMVVYLASITGIDSTYYEAAVIDGASKWQQTLRITLPLLKNIMIIMGIMALGRVFNSDFGLFYQAPRDQSPLYPSTQTLDVLIYKMLTKMNNISMSAAAALFQSFFGCITLLTANFIVTKIDADSAFF